NRQVGLSTIRIPPHPVLRATLAVMNRTCHAILPINGYVLLAVAQANQYDRRMRRRYYQLCKLCPGFSPAKRPQMTCLRSATSPLHSRKTPTGRAI
ncbi:MAG: hypothetical protein MK364_00355, partial [Pirellulales bacterium]|nr:hypothetical protein [Pirellulales bacterium]